jgi:uncharacterized membrane protein YeaQ/YmgE (transglycosylase-associated protein family)
MAIRQENGRQEGMATAATLVHFHWEGDTMGFIAWIVVGAIAGWLAGLLVKGGGFGLLVDIIVGIVGAFIGGWLFGVLGIHLGSGWIGSIITAVIGAVILLFVIRLIKRA